MARTESLTLDVSDPAVIRAEYVETENGHPIKGTITFERANVAYVLEQVTAAMADAYEYDAQAQRGDDAIHVYVSGNEVRPIINVRVRRPMGKGGLMLSMASAQTLVDSLKKL